MALPLERLFTAESYERIVATVDGELAPDHAMPKNYEKNYELQLHHKTATCDGSRSARAPCWTTTASRPG